MDRDDVSVSSSLASAAGTAGAAAPGAASAANLSASLASIAASATATPPLSRSVSQQSAASGRSRRSMRGPGGGGNGGGSGVGRRGSSRVPPGGRNSSVTPSSSAASDDNKSLTSFPSFSPEVPRPALQQRASLLTTTAAAALVESLTSQPTTTTTVASNGPPVPSASTLTSTSTVPTTSTSSSTAAAARNALFEDAPPLPGSKILPGALHLTDDAHIARLIGKHGAVALVRQLAEDLAVRDAQIAALRARAAERERMLRKLILECGLSSLDLETRLRALEQEGQARKQSQGGGGGGGDSMTSADVSDLVSDAMADDHSLRPGRDSGSGSSLYYNGATIRASGSGGGGGGGGGGGNNTKTTGGYGTIKGWKDYLWGSGGGASGSASKNPSRASSINGDYNNTAIRIPSGGSVDARPSLSDDLFQPPLPTAETAAAAAAAVAAGIPRSQSRASSLHSSAAQSTTAAASSSGRKSSLASLALRLVGGGGGGGGGSNYGSEDGSSTTAAEGVMARGRAGGLASSGSLRTASASRKLTRGASATALASASASASLPRSTRAATLQGGGPGRAGPKALMAMRRTTSTASVLISAAVSGGSAGGAGANGSPPIAATPRGQAQERWGEMMEASPAAGDGFVRPENYGPVEMDTILPPEVQPPTLTHMYNRYNSSGYLIDRFGFIYDQRRKKRQREAAQMARHSMKRGGGVHRHHAEMLGSGRPSSLHSHHEGGEAGDESENGSKADPEPDTDPDVDDPSTADDSRPLSPAMSLDNVSIPEAAKDSSSTPKRWQDYLKIATFPTELLSHTPAMSDLTIEVVSEDGGGGSSSSSGGGGVAGEPGPKSPGFRTADGRGFVPSTGTTAAATTAATTTATALDSDSIASGTTEATTDSRQAAKDDPSQLLPRPPLRIKKQQQQQATLVKEDVEPVRLLLGQLSELHDTLQKERTVRWNEFLRKVRAERRREGEAAAATAAAEAQARFLKATAVMPETRLADGEIVGVAGLGNKGKLGRAKWNEFRSLVLGGIPVLLRAKVWAECTGATSLRVPGAYESLVRSSPESDPDVTAQIQADIHRTLTDNIFFREGPGAAKLAEVLGAYARRNPDVGYCQGMNLIAANLLLLTPSAEDAFWLLASIVETILPPGYYDHSLAASRADQQVLRGYVAALLPRLSARFDDLAIDLETMTFQWFLSVFTDCLSAEALFRVWDVVFCLADGAVFLFQVALALLKLNEPQLLLRCPTPAAVYTYINHQMTNHAISIDGLIQASEALRKLVRRDDVEARRQAAMDADRAQIEARQQRAAERAERVEAQRAAEAAQRTAAGTAVT